MRENNNKKVRSVASILLRFGLGLFILIALLIVTPHISMAFDLGYHWDLNRDALVELGVRRDSDALKVINVMNMNCDLFEQAKAVISGALDAWYFFIPLPIAGFCHLMYPQDCRDLSDTYLHFDALSNYTEVEAQWDRLLKNTYRAVILARGDNDVLGFLTILGISLHQVQDFYSHSNWVNLELQGDGDATWFDVHPDVKRTLAIRTTGVSGSVYDHTGYHKDFAGRPGFEGAYHLAYYATLQWAEKVRSWVGSDFWNRAMNYNCPTLLQIDIELFFTKYLSWYVGHYKGVDEKSSDDFLAVILAYINYGFTNPVTARIRWYYINKWMSWCRFLTSMPDSGTYPADLSQMSYPLKRYWLRINITSVRQTDNDPIWDIDPGGKADFYGKVFVNGVEYLLPMHEDKDSVELTNWIVLVPFSSIPARLDLSIQVWDEDCVGGGVLPSLRGADDMCDIDPALEEKPGGNRTTYLQWVFLNMKLWLMVSAMVLLGMSLMGMGTRQKLFSMSLLTIFQGEGSHQR